MLQALAHLLPLALAVAISSVPIMATILILLSPSRTRSALPFLIGWVLGIAVVVWLCALGAQAVPTPRSSRQPDTAVGIGEILVGAALIVIAIVAWYREKKNPSTTMPKWLDTVGSLGPWSAFGVAFALNLRPKGLLLAMAAGLAIRGDDLSLAESAVAIMVYTVVGASTVAVPIILTLASPKRMEPRLVAAQDWIARNNGEITAIILLVIGVVIIGTGIGRL
ncbi:MAG: GAP family protein [Actinomycetota bacterium]|nr:GAP family protein [Actinomycetota bacterium]MDQ2698039.1 GAP family protein [Actinomycetota bacterium]